MNVYESCGARHVPKQEPEVPEPIVNDCVAFKWGALALAIIAGLGAIIGTVIAGIGLAFPPAFVLGCVILSGIGLGLFQTLQKLEGTS